MISFVILPLKMAKTCSEKCPGVLIADLMYTTSHEIILEFLDITGDHLPNIKSRL